MKSRCKHLLLGTVLVNVLMLAALGYCLYRITSAAVWREFDQTLLVKAQALSTMTENVDGKTTLDPEASQLREYQHDEYFQLWSENPIPDQGSGPAVLARSPSLERFGLTAIWRLHSDAEIVGRGNPVILPNGKPGRELSMIFQPRQDSEDNVAKNPAPRLRIGVARATQYTDALLRQVAWRLIVAWVAATALISVAMIFVVHGGLRPVRRLAREIHAISPDDLSPRLARAQTPSELVPLVDRLNDLLRRLELAMAWERTFSADVAHELRTPLAGMQTALEVCLSRERGPVEYQATLQRILTMVRAPHRMMENLLLLARAEKRQLAVTRRRVSWSDLLESSWEPCRQAAAVRNLQVNWQGVTAATLTTDPELLSLILRNLFDNAVSYADAGGRITVRLSQDAGTGAGSNCIEITNTGSQVAAEDFGQVFERFWRADAARTDTDLHCGLGLALCQRVAGILGGSLVVISTRGGEFRVQLTLPTPTAP